MYGLVFFTCIMREIKKGILSKERECPFPHQHIGEMLLLVAKASTKASTVTSAVRIIGVRIWIVVRIRWIGVWVWGIRVWLWNDNNLRASSSTEKDRISLVFRNHLISQFRRVILLLVILIWLHLANGTPLIVCMCSSSIRDIRLCGALSVWKWAYVQKGRNKKRKGTCSPSFFNV